MSIEEKLSRQHQIRSLILVEKSTQLFSFTLLAMKKRERGKYAARASRPTSHCGRGGTWRTLTWCSGGNDNYFNLGIIIAQYLMFLIGCYDDAQLYDACFKASFVCSLRAPFMGSHTYRFQLRVQK